MAEPVVMSYVVDSRAVVERDERYVLVAPFGSYPTLGKYLLARGLFEQFGNSLSLKCHIL